MSDPVIVPRADHIISRKQIDSDALRVLYRLHEHHFAAYLVGGSVRDLLLGRRPKDFDIGTDAHPYQIKRLFRNCWIIGRRFRLAHIKFGTKTIEVATFRQNLVADATVAAETASMPAGEPEAVVVASAGPGDGEAAEPAANGDAAAAETPRDAAPDSGMIHRDNTFGTPEEDAFRRDFTINGLFYDIATFSIIDYVGGLRDLEQRVIRSIGDPRVRFVEDPVRMIRAAVFAARLGFDLDADVVEAIAIHRTLITKASPARLLEEYFKILRSGYAEATFRALARERLLELITPELKSPPPALWDSLARLDAYRQRFGASPPELTTAMLIGSLLIPTDSLTPRPTRADADPRADRVSFGILPIARKDVDRLRFVQQTLPRLTDSSLPARLVRGIVHRPSFDDSLMWLEVFGDSPDDVERWKLARLERVQPAHPHGHGHPPGHGHGTGHAHAPHHGRGHGSADAGDVARPEGDAAPVDAAAPARKRRRRRRRRRKPAV